MLDKAVFLAHALTTFMMTGVIWFVQLAHYPLLAFMGKKEFVLYEKHYVKSIMPFAVLILLIELATAILLIWIRPLGIPNWQIYTSLILLSIAWLSTWLIQVPQHKILESGFNKKAHKILVSTNWIRTVAWTSRAIIVLLMIESALP